MMSKSYVKELPSKAPRVIMQVYLSGLTSSLKYFI